MGIFFSLHSQSLFLTIRESITLRSFCVHVLWIRLSLVVEARQRISNTPFVQRHKLRWNHVVRSFHFLSFSFVVCLANIKHCLHVEWKNRERVRMDVHVDGGGSKLYKIYLIWHSYGNIVTCQTKTTAERVLQQRQNISNFVLCAKENMHKIFENGKNKNLEWERRIWWSRRLKTHQPSTKCNILQICDHM